MLKPWKPDFGGAISHILLDKNISLEEATIITLNQYQQNIEEVLIAYEYLLNEGLPKANLKNNEPKSKKNYNLFLRFYASAKKDLKEKGEVSKKTLKIIEDAKSE